MKKHFLPLLLLSLAAAAQGVQAATYYVAKTGRDANAGSASAPFLSIKRGLAALRSGDTLLVRAGVYAESFYDGIAGGASWSAPTTVKAYPGETVTIKPPTGSARVFTFTNAHYIVLDGFIMDGANVTYDVLKITWSGSNTASHIRVQNSEIKNGPATGILTGATSPGNEFINLKVHDNGRNDFDHGLYIQGNNNLVDRSDVYNNSGAGIHIYNEYAGSSANNNVVRASKLHHNARVGDRGFGIVCTSGAGNTVYNNLIWANSGGVQLDYRSDIAKVFNNTIYDNNAGITHSGIFIGQGAPRSVVQNNIVFRHVKGDIVGAPTGAVISHNVTSDPLFVNAAGPDFRLRAGSPAIDKGLALSAVAVDYAGARRPIGPAYDIGALEYADATTSPADVAAPIISAVAASGVSATGAAVGWTTSEPADGLVEYGRTSAYGSATPLNTARSTSHSAALAGLTPDALYHYRVKSKDAAGNLATSPDATFTTAASPPAAGCAASATAWKNVAMPAQTGPFTLTFDAAPSGANIDGVTGLSNGAASGFSSLAAAVRFNTLGRIDARSGGVYTAAGAIPYAPGVVYRFRLVVDPAARQYSAYVKAGASTEQLLGANYAFRTEQAGASRLDNLALVATTGSHTVCQASLVPAAGADDALAPVISGVSAAGLSASGATISWTTNEPADSLVEYGPTTAYGKSTPLDAARATAHRVSLSGLTAGALYHYRVKSKDAAGNAAASPDFTFTTSAAETCVTSAAGWLNVPLPARAGAFTVEFDATPLGTAIDGVLGLSKGAASDYSSLAAAVRFNNAGKIDARSGGGYTAAASIPYAANLAYRFRLVVDVSAKTYSAYVRQGTGAEQTIGSRLAFRTEQAGVASLDNLGLSSTAGRATVCGAAVR